MAIPAAAIPILIDVLNACVTVADIIRDVSGTDATSTTQIDWGQVVNGKGYYIYQDEYGAQSIKPVTYLINTSINSNTYVIFGDEVYAFAQKKDPPVGTSSPSITRYLNGTQTAYLDWSGQSYFDTVLQIPGYGNVTKSNFIVRFLSSPPSVPTSGSLAYKYIYGAAHSQGAEIYALTTDSHYGIDFTTMGGLATSTGAPYANVRGKTASYDDVNVYLLDWANTQASEQGVTDEDGNQFYFTIDDMPSWEEASEGELETETEPTEPETGSGCCQPDYDEILSEDELESILNGETYELIPVETDIFEDLQVAETLPGQIQNLPAELVATSNSVVDYGSQVVSELGLTPVYAPLLVFSLICYILRGCA